MQSMQTFNNPNISCCVSKCKNFNTPNPLVDLYPLPKNYYERSLWIKLLNIPDELAELPNTRVCGLHFRYKYFLNQKNQANGQAASTPQSMPITILLNDNKGTRFITASSNINTNSGQAQIPINSGMRQFVPGLVPSKPGNVLRAFVPQTTVQQNYVSLSGGQSVVNTPVINGPNLLVNGELMLECQEETLSAAQLSVQDNEWLALNKLIEDVTVPLTSATQSPATYVSSNISVNPIQLNNVQYMPQSTNNQIVIPVSMPSTSSGQQFIQIPASSFNQPILNRQNSLVNINNLKTNIVNYLPQNLIHTSSSPTFVKIQPASQTYKSPQIVHIESQNPTANIQYVNSPPSTFKPQILQIGQKQIQFFATPNQNVIKPVNLGESSGLSTTPTTLFSIINPPPVISNSQFSTTVNQSHSTSLAKIIPPSSASSSVEIKADSNDNDFMLSLLPSFLQPNNPSETSENAFPVRLERVDEEPGEEITLTADSPETILPLIPKSEETGLPLSEASKSTPDAKDPLLPTQMVTSQLEESDDEILIDDPDLSNVAAVYGEESLPKSSASVQKSAYQAHIVEEYPSQSSSPSFGLLDNVLQMQTIQSIFDAHSQKSGVNILKNYLEHRMNQQRPFENPDSPPAVAVHSTPSNDLGPVIVDVMSATDGGQAIYTGDNVPVNSDTAQNVSEDQKGGNRGIIVIDRNKVQKTVSIVRNEKTANSPAIITSFPKIMHTHSIFSLQKSIPVIPILNLINPDTGNLFQIKTQHATKNQRYDAEALRRRLRAENFVVNSVWWLLSKQCMAMNPPCNLCGGKYFNIERNSKFYDGYCWTCRNIHCCTKEPIRRPKFFERFKFYTLEDLLILTYHWACQSDLCDIVLDVQLNVEKIRQYFKALQDLCRDIVEKGSKLGSCHKARVEISVVKLGNYFILGALERPTRYTRLQVLTLEQAFESAHHLNLLKDWIHEDTTLISETKIPDPFLPKIHKVSADLSFNDCKSNGYHILNISRYLVKSMISMFGKLKLHAMPLNAIQGYLNELQWRDRYGKFNDQAFCNILSHIGSLNEKIEETVNVQLCDLKGDLSFEHLNSTLLERWGPFDKNKILAPEEIDIDAPTSTISNNDKLVEHNQEASKEAMKGSGSRKHLNNQEASKEVVKVNSNEKAPVKNVKTYGKLVPPSISSQEKRIKNKFLIEGFLNMLFQDLPEVAGGECYVTPKALLSIKITFDDSPEYIEKYRADSMSLGLRLSAEGFINSPVRWLVKKCFIKSKAPCYVCSSQSLLRDNTKYSDGCSWSCQNKSCRFENVFKRPHFYARFPMLPMAHMSAVIFHWTVQSDFQRIITDAPMDISKLAHVWRSFQVLCSTSLRRKKVKLGGEQEIVEVAMVQYGKIYILGAMERKTKHTLLRTFPIDVQQQVQLFFKVLSQWITPNSFVVVSGTKYFELPPEYNIMAADISITDPDDTGFHVLNITTYLLKQISTMFGHLRADDVRVEVMQIYLEEMMWRERFGKMPTEAFYNILGDIFDLEITGGRGFSDERHHISPFGINKADLSNQLNDIVNTTVVHTIESHQEKVSTQIPIEEIDPKSLPELRIVLRRISEEVLKYYDCLPVPVPITMEKEESEDKKGEDRHAIFAPYRKLGFIGDSSRRVYYDACKPKVGNANQKTYAKFFKSQSEQSGSVSSYISKKHSQTKSKKRPMIIESDEDSDLEIMEKISFANDESLSSTASSDSKSENSRTSISSQKKSPRKKIATGELICVECGKNISVDHFTKQFMCMDCKSSVYSTYCCNSFMEHRGSLLFGKRMPHRHKDVYGLHKPRKLQDSYYCSCGYSSNIGNRLASHMVACQKSTCFYQADIS